jgi:uncharacterized membrane protein YvbJ
MTNCVNCGNKLCNKDNFCSNCGLSIKDNKTEEFEVSSDDLIKTVKKIIHEGNVRRIIIRDENDKTLLDIPISIGVIGSIIAPWLAALGLIGAIATNCKITVIRRK